MSYTVRLVDLNWKHERESCDACPHVEIQAGRETEIVKTCGTIPGKLHKNSNTEPINKNKKTC